MHHFFIPPDSIHGQEVTFPHPLAHQIWHVLRLREGDRVAVLDNSGKRFTVVLGDTGGEQVLTGQILRADTVTSEPHTHLALYFGLSSREKVEWILQKGTEIGVSAFCPFISSRTLVTSPDFSTKKLARWERIIQEAAEQSGRGRLPALNAPENLLKCILMAQSEYDLCLMAWEGASRDDFKLGELRPRFGRDSIALFVGPEGGFSAEEVDAAMEAGVQIVSLGARILRMETAALVFPALVLHELETR
ncbi:MAG: RsmE family RNA methyltransferase [Brevefilum sp.]